MTLQDLEILVSQLAVCDDATGKMMSRTFRYVKLIYIVAGILMSNEKVCESVDKMQITPRVEVKQILQPKKVYKGVEKASRNWFRSSYCFIVSRIKQRAAPLLSIFNIWTIPNYLVDCTTNFISKQFIGSDCDMIYNR
ncbi:PREDICTED: uncharacterized protein LOC108379343 [Rhagoletis zephyria]|uniref:uncharacterized protein LOC108379343 n=1 Tax=Rhagoletis zephyria TaxID=28612 RepID=UPI00081179E8|nr:PREDICTED: uncharacterized protein LOC108379343 [Rhagoletis zephyria]XP_036337651.1 uncharacterized protein LOC118747688 [Rhagoletis pomonella]